MTMATDKVPTISVTIDHESRKLPFRHSLQPKSTPLEIPARVRRSTSIGRNRLQNSLKKPSVPDIPESEKNEDDESVTEVPSVHGTTMAADNTRISFTKKSRKVSNISKASKRSSVPSGGHLERNGTTSDGGNGGSGAYVNHGYVAAGLSTRSSSIHGSMSSLPVMREQYCCCQRWTRMEKNLAIIVACLALIIICLVVTIGIVANHTDTPIDNYFMTLKF